MCMVLKHVAPADCRSRNNLLGEVGVSGAVRGLLAVGRATGLPLVVATDCPTTTGRVKT